MTRVLADRADRAVRAGAAGSPEPPGTPPAWRQPALAVGVTAVVAAAVVALVFLLSGPVARTLPPGVVEVAGGQVSVSVVRPEVMNHPAGMPASMMPDPVPAGYARYSVEITLTADDDEPLTYSASRIRLEAGGEPPVGPVRESLGDGVLPEGSALTTSLVYEVPEDARRATLVVDGHEVALRLPAGAGHHTPTVGEGGGHPSVTGGADVDEHGGSSKEP